MYFITTKRMLEVCFFQHTPTFIIEPFCVTGNSQLHKRHERAKDAHKVRLTVYLQGSDSSGLVFKEGMR